MATSSRYLQLSSSILLEYIYADQSNLEQHRIDTNFNGLWKYKGFNVSDTKNHMVIHGERSYRQDNCYIEDLDRIGKIKRLRNLVLSDDIYSEINLTGESPVYDKIKIHFTQGFNYEKYGGFSLKAFLKTTYQKQISLLQFITTKGDSYGQLNPTPFFFGGKHYTNFIELNILSSYNLIFDYFFGEDKTVVNEVTRSSTIEGLVQDQLLQFKFSWLDEKEIINNVECHFEKESKIFDISIKDDYSELGVYINESPEFDYFEYSATVNGRIDKFEDFINALNNSGNDYILIHTLNLYEFINLPGIEPYWLLSDSLEISQVDNFGKLNLFRPIIKGDNTFKFKIEYILRFYNRIDNSYIWKTGSIISNNVYKYGKSLISIQLDENPVQNILYNKNVIKKIEVPVEGVLNTQNIFAPNSSSPIVNNYNLIVSSENLSSLNYKIGKRISPLDPSYSTKIILSNSTNYLKFTMSRELVGSSRTAYNLLDLNTVGKIYIRFYNKDRNYIELEEYLNKNLTNKDLGEVLFRIPENSVNKILSWSTIGSFDILTGSLDKTVLSSGTYFSVDAWNKTEIDNLDKLKTDNQQLNIDIINLTNELNELRTEYAKLKDQLKNPSINPNTYNTSGQSSAIISSPPVNQSSEPFFANNDIDYNDEMNKIYAELAAAQEKASELLRDIQSKIK